MAASSYQMNHIGGKAFNHSQSNDAEAEYDRLRDLARQEASKRGSCFDKAHRAYEKGDGAGAHQLSEEGKKHAAQMDAYNRQASEFIFRENNAPGRVDGDTIDLHGQFVEEAERILEQRIKYAQQQGQQGLHVIVGKGNHSANHIQKIKPRVEQVCRELGLKYVTEPNAGRMYVNLQGGAAVIPSGGSHGGQHGGQSHSAPQQGYQSPHQPQYQSGQQHQQQQQQNNNQQDPITTLLSMLLKCFCSK